MKWRTLVVPAFVVISAAFTACGVRDNEGGAAPILLFTGKGTSPNDVAAVADLLGTKLVANEMVAFVKLNTQYADVMSERSQILATYGRGRVNLEAAAERLLGKPFSF